MHWNKCVFNWRWWVRTRQSSLSLADIHPSRTHVSVLEKSSVSVSEVSCALNWQWWVSKKKAGGCFSWHPSSATHMCWCKNILTFCVCFRQLGQFCSCIAEHMPPSFLAQHSFQISAGYLLNTHMRIITLALTSVKKCIVSMVRDNVTHSPLRLTCRSLKPWLGIDWASSHPHASRPTTSPRTQRLRSASTPAPAKPADEGWGVDAAVFV